MSDQPWSARELEDGDDLRPVSRTREGERLVMRFDGRDEVVECEAEDGHTVIWRTLDGGRGGLMSARFWDLNLRRQRAAAEGGGA